MARWAAAKLSQACASAVSPRAAGGVLAALPRVLRGVGEGKGAPHHSTPPIQIASLRGRKEQEVEI